MTCHANGKRAVLITQDRLDDLGFKPFAPLVKHLLETFAPFDLQPAPDADAEVMDALAEVDWQGRYHPDYVVPTELADRAAVRDDLRRTKAFGRPREAKPDFDLAGILGEEEIVDKDRVHKLTQTLAYLHSRGQLTAACTFGEVC